MRLWPRLPLPRARARVSQLVGRSLEELERASVGATGSLLFAPTGGAPVDQATIRSLRQDLDRTAVRAGYPSIRTRAAHATFDDAALRLLADFPIPVGEAIRPETWAWIAVELVPHLVTWRWTDKNGKVSTERFAGTLVRNSLGRLWYQANRLDRGRTHPDRWLYSDLFTSDQAVALLERPGLAANRRLCLAIGRVWSELPAKNRREGVFREAMKALIVRAGLIRLDVLDDDMLHQVVDDCFASILEALAGAGALAGA